MNLITMIKSKLIGFLCVALFTALCISYLSGRDARNELTDVSKKLVEHVALNKQLSEQNLAMAKEIKDKPVEYITITKDVAKEVCNGVVKQTMINSLPSKRESANEETKHTADIDDRLPADLIKLLN